MSGIYFKVLRAAIRDIAEHGYDSEQRVQAWSTRILEALRQQLVPISTAQGTVTAHVARIYRRAVEREMILKDHKGVARFTLQKVKPQLRAELDRRIAASANLIRLNRQKAIEQTMQRFQGWATSVPAGGSKAVQKAEEAERVRKSLSSLTYEERRVAIDQGHKLIASVNSIVAENGGAIAGKWHSMFRQKHYNYREDHKERDHGETGNVYLIRGSWAHKKGFVKPMKCGYTDQITQAGEEVNCRCQYQYVYNLRDLPEEMLTDKGRAALAEARSKIAAIVEAA